MVQTEYRFKTRPALALVLAGAVALALGFAPVGSKSAAADPRSEFQKLLEEQGVASPAKIALLDSMPEDVRCDSVAANGSRIAITCTASGYDTVGMFYENLTDTQYFDNVGLDRAACVAESVQFEMSLWIGPGASPALQSTNLDPRSKFQKLLEEQKVASPTKIALLDSMPGPVRCLFSQQPNPPNKTARLESMLVHVRVNRVAARGSNIAISGTASGYDAVGTFYTNLEASKYFDEVTLGTAFKVPLGVQFQMSLRVGPASLDLQSADPESLKAFQKLLDEQSIASPIRTALLESMPLHVRVDSVAAGGSKIAITGTAAILRVS